MVGRALKRVLAGRFNKWVGFCSISKWPFILLLIQVLLFHDQNYGIHYEYTVPVNYTAENQSEPEKPQDSLFIWTHSGWEGCSVQCGGGECQGCGLGRAWDFAEGWNKFRALCSQCTEQGRGRSHNLHLLAQEHNHVPLQICLQNT